MTAYIIRLRHQTVIDLVGNGMKIEEAAYRAGFSTYSYFYKTFVKSFGISPRAYFLSNK